jgi:predicted phosphoribosyltransferase
MGGTMAHRFFADLSSGGQELAGALTTYAADRDALVLGLVRGGVPASLEVARRLDLPLDVLLLTALLTDASGEVLRAISVAGTLVPDQGCAAQPPGAIERLVFDDGVRALTARAAACRGPRPAAGIAGRTILLIDNGMRTGQTMAAAIRAVRTLNPDHVIAAVPVGAAAAVTLAGGRADHFHCLVTPPFLGNVAMAYHRFDVPGDDRIRDLLERA